MLEAESDNEYPLPACQLLPTSPAPPPHTRPSSLPSFLFLVPLWTRTAVGAVSGGLFKAVLFKKAPLIAVGTAFGLGMAV